MQTERQQLTGELAKHEAEFSGLSDDEIRGEMLKWKQFTPQWQAGDAILKKRERERDPTRTILSNLASRVENIERTATRSEFKTWSLWIAISALLLSAAMLALMIFH